MTRNVFGWDLPPGVTQRMIDEAVGADDPTEEINDIEDEIAKLGKEMTDILIRIRKLRARLGEIKRDEG
jgi:hypothetical protein